MSKLELDNLDETDFEEFCFELLHELGFVNVDWRKGTGLGSSPADGGRDIVAQWQHTDIDNSTHLETWFIECKHQRRGVPPGQLQGLLSWANAERPQTVLVIASNFLSNPAKDYLRDYELNNRPAFRIKYWERPQLDRLTRNKRQFLDRFMVGGTRTQAEILAAEQEFFDRVWHERHLVFMARIEGGEDSGTSPEVIKAAQEAAERVVATYPPGEIRPVEDDFEWGFWSGKLSALRWVLGDDWDFLDT
ncbi:MAG: restriction endonuclease [bacterium]